MSWIAVSMVCWGIHSNKIFHSIGTVSNEHEIKLYALVITCFNCNRYAMIFSAGVTQTLSVLVVKQLFQRFLLLFGHYVHPEREETAH